MMEKIGRIKGKEGVSEIIGTVLLLAIAVIIFSSLIVYVLSMDTSPSAPSVHMVGSMDESSIATIENRGGNSVPIEDLKVMIRKGDNQSHIYSGEALSAMFHDTNDNGRWDVGDYITVNCSKIFSGDVARWQISVAVIDQPSNAIIMSGVLQQGIMHTMPPVARFTYAPWDPKTKEIVTFNASDSYDPDGGSLQSYQWDFGDGNTGSGMVVMHQYNTSGNYTISLTITDDEGQTASTSSPYGVPAEVNVTTNQKPVANFTWTNNTGKNGVVAFTDGSYDTDGEIVSWYWNFGDGSVSTAQNPSHYYNQSGTYTVTLAVTDDNNETNTTSLDVVVPNLDPEAFFSYSPSNPTTKHYVFFDGSNSYDRDGSIQSYSWDLNGDGVFGDATVAKPSTTYGSTGNYTVGLKVTDDLGATDIETKTLNVSSPMTSRSVLVVDNTPQATGGRANWDGTDKIIQALSNLGFSYSTGKAIDSWQFVDGTEAGKNITATLLDEYDIVIWSTGTFPGDGGRAADDNNDNTWTTSMTEGSDDESNHVYEIYQHMNHNGTLLLCGTYAVRDLQDYSGNEANQDEIWLGNTLGLIEDTGGINEGYHSGKTGYYATDYYNYPYDPPGSPGWYYSGEFSYGPIQGSGVMTGRTGTSTDSDTYGVANVEITSPIDMYELNPQGGTLFNYSLNATGGAGIVLQTDFESGAFPPSGWSEHRLETNNGPGWQKNNRAGGGQSAYHDHTQQDDKVCNDWIVSPQFTVPPGGVLDFEEKNGYMNYYDYHGVMISTGSGDPDDADFTELQEMDDATFWNWEDRSIDISSYAGQDVHIAFQYKGGDAAIWAIDNIEVSSSADYIRTGEYAIDAERGANRSVVTGFNLNSDAITNESREAYLRNVLNWMAEGVGYETEVYVDNDRSTEWYDETHLHTIQEGIDAVSFGGTVHVYDGDAYDGAVIDKSISLVGENAPVARSSGEAAFKVTADWVQIDGFTIYNKAGQTLQRGVSIDSRSRATILNCTIHNTGTGIYAYHSSNTTFQSNIIHDADYGIQIQRSSGLTVTNNTLWGNSHGLAMQYTSGCEATQNDIHDNDEGIYLYEADDSRIRNNDIYSNTDYGVRLESTPTNNYVIGNDIYQNGYGVYLDLSTHNTIQNNLVTGNTNTGIHLTSSSTQNTIWNNTVTDNGDGIWLDSSGSNSLLSNTVNHSQGNGIYLSSSGGNALYNNQVMNSGSAGVVFHDSSDSNILKFTALYNNTYGLKIERSRNSYVGNNTLWSNRLDGVYLARPTDGAYGNNTIFNNTIYQNVRHGIRLYSASGNTLSDNIIHSNQEHGVSLQSSSNDNSIRNNVLYNNSDGVSIDRSGYSQVVNNNIHNHTGRGISVQNSASENDLLSNTLEHNTDGIAIQSSSLNNISHNLVRENQQYGITVASANTNSLYNNTVHANLQDGIYISSSDDNVINSNVVYDNHYGLHFLSCSSNAISSNHIYANADHGVFLENSEATTPGGNEIATNQIHDNGGSGLYLLSSTGNSFHSNNLYKNSDGIHLRSSNNNVIYLNTVRQNEFGVYLHSSDGNKIGGASEGGNTIYNNTGDGIYIGHSSDGNTLDNNSIWENDVGVFVNDSDTANIKNNHIYWHNTSAGIRVKNAWLGSSYPIKNNMIHGNLRGVEIISSSSSHIETQNLLYDNEIGIYLLNSDTCKVGMNDVTSDVSGITILSSDACTIDNNTIRGSQYGIDVNGSNDNQIQKNRIVNATRGVYLHDAAVSNVVRENTVTINASNQYVAYLAGTGTENNKVYRNNFLNISSRSDSLAYDDAGNNSWYSSATKAEGNYWKNYEYLGRYQNATEKDGYYWSIPYEIAPEDDTSVVEDRRPLTDKV